MDDEEYLAEYIKGLEASVAYFAPGTTKARELHTVNSFLENLRLNFTEEELVSPDDDPPDIAFREARFEIKEILDPGRRRHAEYKAALERAKTLTDPKDSFEMFTPIDVHITDILGRCESAAEELRTKYPDAVRAGLDLLFFVNLQHVFHVIETPFPSTDRLVSLGWRSISFVMGQRSCSFYARVDAPDFIKTALGRIIQSSNNSFKPKLLRGSA
jgi:hypothetical protein